MSGVDRHDRDGTPGFVILYRHPGTPLQFDGAASR